MKLILPENLKNEKAIYVISIYSDMLIIASENKFKPELILQNTDLPQKETKNAYRVLWLLLHNKYGRRNKKSYLIITLTYFKLKLEICFSFGILILGA